MSVTGQNLKIHLLTNCNDKTDKYLDFIDVCAAVGISYLQLRQKNWSDSDLLAFGIDLKQVLAKYPTKLIVNDNLDLALKLDADGIHLGQSDISVVTAREVLGQEKIIGLSIESIEQLHLANTIEELDYIAVSSVFATKSKANIRNIWGLSGLKECCQISKHRVVAIGGIDLSNITEVLKMGANEVAIISAIHEADDPCFYIKELAAKYKAGNEG